MTRQIAFLRAVNVGGRVVKMDRLRRVFEGLGLANVETFIASGNVIFNGEGGAPDGLGTLIETALLAELGFAVEAFVRTDAEVDRIAGFQPFPADRYASALAYNVGLLAGPLVGDSGALLSAFETGDDDFRHDGSEVYWLCQKKQSDSKFKNKAFEALIRGRATFRGMNTVRKLAAKYPPR